MVLAQGLSDGGWDTSHAKAWLGLENLLPRRPIHRLICWSCFLSRGHGALMCKLLHRDAWMSSWHGAWLRPMQVIQEKAKWKTQYLLWLSLWSQTAISTISYWFHRLALLHVGVDYTRMWIWETQLIGVYLGSWVLLNSMMFTRDLPEVQGLENVWSKVEMALLIADKRDFCKKHYYGYK